jgi:hypothetical protein
MAQALEEQLQWPDIGALSFEERLGLWGDGSLPVGSRRACPRLPDALARPVSRISTRGDRSWRATLATGLGVREHDNVLIVGPTGIGKPQPIQYPYR